MALIVLFLFGVIPAIATAQPGDQRQGSTSSPIRILSPSEMPPPAVYPARSFWDGGEAAHLAYLASLRARLHRAGSRPERTLARTNGGTANPGVAPVFSGQPDWYAIADCESGGAWDINSGNGYWGGLQFAPSTWFGYGGGPFDGTGPFPYSASEQITVAEAVFAAQGSGAWPNCFQWK